MTSVHSGHSQLPAVALPANQPQQFYRGGSSIAQLRGGGDPRSFSPEDWVASVTTRFGQQESGLSQLPDGRLLRDAVSAQPESWLGSEHVNAFGDSTALLVKLLDAGQRLPVHCHPSDRFARQHLGSRFGKTEAWIIVATSGSNPVVYLGFQEDVDSETVAHWVSTQDSSAMLGSLNKIRVNPGDTVVVPAGVPHAIGEGVFLVELQQPTDFSVTLEWQGFLADAETAFLGMDHETALRTVNRTGFAEDTLSALIKQTAKQDDSRVPLLADQASDFFQADRLHPGDTVEIEPSFGVLVVLEGHGGLRCESTGELELRQGNTVVIPHSAGVVELAGDLVAVHCRPPTPWRS